MEARIRRHANMLQCENKTSTTLAPTLPSVTVVASPRRVAAETLVAPPELGWLIAVPEFFDESDDERLAGLDLPARAVAHDE